MIFGAPGVAGSLVGVSVMAVVLGVGHLDARLVIWMHDRRVFRGGYFWGSQDYLEYSR